MDRAAFAAGHGRPVGKPPAARSAPGALRRARHRGCVLFGYFLLHKQEKVTRPPGRRAEKHTDVSRSSCQRDKEQKQKRWAKAHPMKSKWIPAFAGMTTAGDSAARITAENTGT